MEEYRFMFEDGPLRDAMVIYLSTMYEKNADYSEESMVSEYIMLKRNNELHLIFEAVQLQSKIINEAN